MLTDTHCHFEDERYDQDREQVIQDNLKDLAFVVNVSADPNRLEMVASFTQNYENVYGTLGVHPHYALKVSPQETVNKIEALLRAQRDSNKIVGIGECGLDYYFNNQDLEGRTEAEVRDAQKSLFEAQLEFAKKMGLAVSVHTRDSQEGWDAYQDVLEILEKTKIERAVIHSFSGDNKFALEFTNKGFYLGISGILTFGPKQSKTSHGASKINPLVNVIKQVPLEYLLLETDAPYLTPVPHRGKRNEPIYTKFIAEKIAQIKGITLEEVLTVTEQNARKLFNIPV